MNSLLFELNLINQPLIIPETASFIAESALKLGLSKKKTSFLCFTLETVLEYRMKALDESNKEINVRVFDDGRQFRFVIKDLGAPYILSKNQQDILNRKLVDRYELKQEGRKGQSFSFTYRYDAPFTKPVFTEVKKELLDEEFIIRRVINSDEDVLKAITCLYDTYGYDYYHQHLYSVESFRKYMNNGRYVPIILENGHGQPLSYCALDENEWFASLPELSNLVSEPYARGKGLASLMFKRSEEIALKMGYEGIHVSAVAYHSYTQKMCNKFGYTPCAVEYSLNPIGTGGNEEKRRLDCVIAVKIFNKTRKHELYLHSECDEMMKHIFNGEGLNYEIHHDKVNSGENILIYGVDTDTSNCFLKIDECGEDIEEKIDEILNKEEVKNTDVITVNLNMNVPSNLLAYKALRKRGYIVTGCIPGCTNGDFMLLQAYKTTPEYEKIVVLDNYKELVNILYRLNNIKTQGEKQ